MAKFYFSPKIANFSKKLCLTIFLLVLANFKLNAQNCTVNAGVLNVTICETDALVITGNTPSPIIGTVKWTQISGPAVTINSPNSPSTSISGYTGGNTYIFRYSAVCGDGITSFQDKVVNVQPITIANAGGNIASCPNSNGTLTITANTPKNTGETGFWEIVGTNNAGVIINFPDLATSTIALPANKCGTSTLQWVIEGPEYAPGQRCRTTSQITVTNYGGVKPVSAGPDQTLSNCYTVTQTANLTGTYGGCGLNGQSGQWTFVSGPNTPTIGNSSSNTTSVSNLTQGTYTFRWTVTGPCASGNDLVSIIVPAATQDVTTLPGGDEFIFFCDNTITQVTLVAQTPLYAGETVEWTQIAGDTGAQIATPTKPSTLVTNISDSGDPYRFRYTLRNSNTGCVFTKDYIVQYNGATRTIVANNGNDITGSCDATVFTIPLTVTGTGINQYRILSGPDGSPLGPFPTAVQEIGNSVTLTLTASGDYTVEFIRTQNGSLTVGCDYGYDTINIIVSGQPTPSNAGTNVSLPCGDTSTTLSGVVTDEGQHFWSQLSGPNNAVIDNEYAVDTQVSGLISGTYVFQYITKGGGATCGFSISTVTIYVSDSSLSIPDAGTNQIVCVNSQVPLTATTVGSGEIGEWSQVSGPNPITFSDVNNPNAVATGFATAAADYELRWTVSYLHPAPGASCGAPVSDTVIISTTNTIAPTNSDAGPDACYSSGTNTFNLSGNSPTPIEIGLWSVQPSTGVVFADISDPNTLVTVPGNGTYVFTWSINTRLRSCEGSSSSVSVTIADTPPTANAGPDQEVCGNTIVMNATNSTGSTGTWTLISGFADFTVSDIHDPNATFTFIYSGYYIFRWTVDANICGQAFDDINLTIGIPPSIANAGLDQNICNNSTVTMAANDYDDFFELGQWSVLTGAPNQPTIVNPSNPNTVITGLVAGTYTFRWTITARSIFLCSGSFDDMIVIVDPAADAGPDQTYCDVTSIQLKASDNSKGKWTLKSTTYPTFTDIVITQSPPDSYIGNASVVPGYDYVFTFTTSTASFPDGTSCAGTADDVNVTIYNGASINPNAGTDQTLCIADVSGTTTLNGNAPPSGGQTTAEWRITYQPTGSVARITNPSLPNSTVTGLTVPGLYILEWVFTSNNCRTLSDIVRIEMYAAPSAANAGPDDLVACQTTYKTAAVPPAVGIGTWTIDSQPAGANAIIDSPNSPVTTLSNVTVLGNYILRWTVRNGPFVATSLCQPTSDTVEIIFNDDPPSIAKAGPDQELCQATSTNMNADPITIGTGLWTQVSGPNNAQIGSPNSPNSPMLGLTTGTYEFLWTVSTAGCSSQDSVLVTIYSNPSTADAGQNQIVPQFMPVNMNATVPTIGTGVWTQLSGPSTVGFTDETSPTTAVTGTIAGAYSLQWTVSNGNCAVSSDTVLLTILSVADLELTKSVTPTTGSVGDVVTFNLQVFNNNNSQGGTVDATNVGIRDYIPDGFALVPGSVASAGQYNVGDNTITWSGITIPNGTILTLTYKATILRNGSYLNKAEVIASDQYDPDSTPNNQNPAEDDQDDASVVLDVADLSLQKSVSPTSVSINDNVIFTISVLNSGPNNGTGITVLDKLPPGYTYVSDNSGGNYNHNTGIWNIGNLNNGNTRSLQVTAKVNVATAANYVNVSEIQTAKQFDPDSTPGNGLIEDDMSSATVTLKPADLELTKEVLPATAAAGEQVEFTIHVVNIGPGNATGVGVQDIIPEGFTLIPGSVSNGGFYNIANASLTWSNLALASGGTLDLTFRAIVNSLGTYLNTAQITASDLPDPDSTPNNDDGDQSEDDEDNAPFNFIGPTADLSLIKRVVTGNTNVVIGSQTSFELIITNSGPNTATGVLVKDLLPSGYEFVNYSSSAGLYENTFGVWNVGSIASGVSESLIIDAKVLPTGEYKNVAEVTASSLPDPDSTPNNDDGNQTEDDEDSATITAIQPSADLSLTKTVDIANPLVGTMVNFQIVTTNGGPQVARDVEVTDLLPSGYTFSSFNATSGTYDSSTGIWSLDILESSESETLQIIAVVNSSGDYTNIAEITNSDTPDPDSTPSNGITTEDDYATATTTPVAQSSDLSLTKTVDKPTPVVGSLVTFAIVVSNNGPQDNTGVQITDLLPSGYTFTGYTVSTGNYNPSTGLWIVGNLINGKSETLQLLGTANATGVYLNTAEITAADVPDPNSTPGNGDTTENDYATATTAPIARSSDLSVTKTVNNPTPLVGATVTFEIIVTNNGPQINTGVQLTDLLPSGYTFSGYTVSTGSYNSTTGIWTIGNFPDGKSETMQIIATVNATGDYLNTVEVTASDLADPDSTPNNGVITEDDYAAVATTPIALSSDLSLTKTVDNATPVVGSLVTFAIVVSNNGPQDNTGVQVTDLLPSGYTFNVYSVSTGNYNPSTGVWVVGNLINGKSETLQLRATVNSTGDYLNIAEVTASDLPDPDSTPNDNDPTQDDYATATTTPIAQSSDLSLTKTVNNATPLVGASVTFEIITTNNGPQDNTGVQITDLLPSGYTFTGYTVSTGSYNSASGLWNIGNFPNGKSETLQITATVNSSGDYVNIVEVTASDLADPDSTPNNGITTEDDYATVTTIPISQSADLSLTKTVDNATPLVGAQVTFEVIITNNGPQNTSGVTVTDLLPSGYNFNSFTVSTGTYDSATGLWTVGNLVNGDSETLQIIATVNSTGDYLNIAEVSESDLPDPNSTPANGDTTENDYATATTTPIAQSADLSLTKTVNNATPLVGAQVTFEVVVSNNGPQNTTGVSVTDLLPSGYTFNSYSSTIGTYNNANGLWTVGNLSNGGSHTLQITATVNPIGDYLNIAEVSASDLPDPDSTPNNAVTTEDDYATATTTPIAQSADLSLTKTVSNATPLVGAQLTFEVIITNNGPQNTSGVTITDLLPSGYNFNSFTVSTGTYDSATGLWTVGNLVNGDSETLQIIATVNSTGDYLNIAEVSASDLPDPNSTPANGDTTENDYATATTTPIAQSADLSLTKTVNNATPLVGSEVIFEVVVTNNGPQNTTGVSVTDLLPDGYTYVGYRISTGTYNPTNGLWTVGNMINGKSETLQLTATVNAIGNYMSVAEVTSSDLPDPDSTPNNAVITEDDYAAATTTPNQQSADLSLTKTVNNTTPLAASTIVFEIVVKNNGPQDTNGVEVTDLLPSGYTFSSYTSTKGTYNNTTGKWNIGSILNGDSQVLQLSVMVNATGNYENTAEVTASSLPDPNSTPGNGIITENDYDSATVVPRALSADLSLTKTVNNATPLIGSAVTFEIIITNNGLQNTSGVEVTDLLPSGYTYSSFTATKGTYNNATGKWIIGSLPNGDSQTLQLTAIVNTSGDYQNIAEVTASDLPDPNSTPNNGVTTENDYATATTTPNEALADLAVVKTIVGGNFSPVFGSTVTFEIVVANSGPQDATGVQLIDLLPSGYEYTVYSATKGQYLNSLGIWNIGTIPNGTAESLLVTAKINRTGDYRNIAEIYASDQKDPDSTPNNGVFGEDDLSVVLISPVRSIADLSIEKEIVNNDLTPDVGSQITFSITVSNAGPDAATNVVVKDLLPAGYDYIFYNASSGSYNSITGEWSSGIILPGNSHTLLINAFVKTPTGTANEYLNSAEVIKSDQFDPDSRPDNGVTTEDDYDSIEVTPVIVQADLSLTKRALSGNTSQDVGSTVIFEITVTNDGPGNASGVRVRDLLPAGFTYLTYTATGGIYNHITGIWATGLVNSGNTQTLQIYARINGPSGQANEYLNIAEVTASNLPDPDSTPDNGVTTEDDYDSVQINVNVADLSLDKTVSNKNANVNEVVTFSLQIGNDGPGAATGVAIEDLIPLGYKNISNITNGGIFSSNTIRWVDLDVPLGGITLTYQATVDDPYGLDHFDFLNIAQITASNQFDPDSTPDNDNGDQSEDDEDSEFINIPSTDIAINKEVDKTDVPMYSEVIFTIKAENLGNLTATNVEVQDLLPKGYQLDSFTVTAGVYNGTTGLWTIPDITPGNAQTLTLTVKVQDFNDYVNNARLLKLDQIDSNSSNNQDSASVTANCLKIYNEFSPNDDGQNDTFYIDCITRYPDNKLEIFNRWGNLVYFKQGYDNTWDGKADGSAKTLPEGTYFYILDLGDGSKKTSGWLYLK